MFATDLREPKWQEAGEVPALTLNICQLRYERGKSLQDNVISRTRRAERSAAQPVR